MTPAERAKKFYKAILTALREFGEYTYHDKGPREVMDLDPIIDELMALPAREAAETLKLVLRTSKKHGERFVSACIMGLDHWDKFDDLLDHDEGLRELY